MHRPPKDWHTRILELLQISRDDIHLGTPLLVYVRAGRQKLLPLGVGEMSLNTRRAAPEHHRLICSGPHLVPANRDDRTVLVLLDQFFYRHVPGVNRVNITVLGKSPRSEERRVGKECRSRWSP